MPRSLLCHLVVIPLGVLCGLALSARAEDPILPAPVATGTLRSGAAVSAIAAHDSPWAVVLIAARIPDAALTPAHRASLTALAEALAQGRSAGQPGGLDLLPIGGQVRARVDADTLAVALGAPADKLDDLLRGVDARLRARRSLLPAQGPTLALPDEAPALLPDTLAAAAPGHPDALPIRLPADTLPDPRLLRELAELVLGAAQLRVVVVGPRTGADLVAAAQRAITAPLPPGDARAAVPHTLGSGTTLVESRSEARTTASRVVLLCADADPHGSAAARAAVLAELLGGQLQWTDDAVAVVIDRESARASAAPRAEGKLLETVAALAQTPPPDDAVRDARARVRAHRMALWKDPTALAVAVARAQDAGGPAAGLAALDATDATAVQEVARRCATGPRVIVRSLGMER